MGAVSSLIGLIKLIFVLFVAVLVIAVFVDQTTASLTWALIVHLVGNGADALRYVWNW